MPIIDHISRSKHSSAYVHVFTRFLLQFAYLLDTNGTKSFSSSLKLTANDWLTDGRRQTTSRVPVEQGYSKRFLARHRSVAPGYVFYGPNTIYSLSKAPLSRQLGFGISCRREIDTKCPWFGMFIRLSTKYILASLCCNNSRSFT